MYGADFKAIRISNLSESTTGDFDPLSMASGGGEDRPTTRAYAQFVEDGARFLGKQRITAGVVGIARRSLVRAQGCVGSNRTSTWIRPYSPTGISNLPIFQPAPFDDHRRNGFVLANQLRAITHVRSLPPIALFSWKLGIFFINRFCDPVIFLQILNILSRPIKIKQILFMPCRHLLAWAVGKMLQQGFAILALVCSLENKLRLHCPSTVSIRVVPLWRNGCIQKHKIHINEIWISNIF